MQNIYFAFTLFLLDLHHTNTLLFVFQLMLKGKPRLSDKGLQAFAWA